MENHIKTIKMVATKIYEIMLVELPSGRYQVMYEVDNKVNMSSVVTDYNLASTIFDTHLDILEGH